MIHCLLYLVGEILCTYVSGMIGDAACEVCGMYQSTGGMWGGAGANGNASVTTACPGKSA